MELEELKEYVKKNPTRNIKGVPARRHGVLTDAQSKAILMKVHDLLGDTEIARQLTAQGHPVTQQGVSGWWKAAHVKHELDFETHRYNTVIRPEHIVEAEEIRKLTLREIKDRANKPESKLGELTGVLKITNDMIDREGQREMENEDNAQAAADLDILWDKATPEQQEQMARIAAFGDKTPIQEAEVIDVDEDTSIEAGDN